MPRATQQVRAELDSREKMPTLCLRMDAEFCIGEEAQTFPLSLAWVRLLFLYCQSLWALETPGSRARGLS